MPDPTIDSLAKDIARNIGMPDAVDEIRHNLRFAENILRREIIGKHREELRLLISMVNDSLHSLHLIRQQIDDALENDHA